MFLVSVIGFTIASALCGAATSLMQLVLYRLLQGICGAALVPLSQSVLLRSNPPERHGQAMAIWGIGTMLGPIIGPALGGWLTDNFTWRWVFLINLPVGVLCAIGILVFIHDDRHGHRERFDFFGFGTLSVAVGAVQMMLDRGELKDWFGSTEIWVEATVAALCFYLFIVHTATTSASSFLNRNDAEGPQFHRRLHPDVLCRHHPQRHDGAVADDDAGAVELSGRDRRVRHRAARHRHPGRDGSRRAASSARSTRGSLSSPASR